MPVGGNTDSELELAARAAWFYHVAKMRQVEVAIELGLSVNKVNRLLALAENRGVVRTVVEGPIAICSKLEETLVEAFGLASAYVVPDVDDAEFPAAALGRAAATRLQSALEREKPRIVGIGRGRPLDDVGRSIPNARAERDVEFVALTGCEPFHGGHAPNDLLSTLAKRLGGSARMIPGSLYVDGAGDRTVLMRQRAVRAAMEDGAAATVHVVGMDSAQVRSTIDACAGLVTADDLASIRGSAATGEVLGAYYDAGGVKVPLALHKRLIALPLEDIKGHVIGVAGGEGNAAAIVSVLRTRRVSELVTTERTAKAVLGRLKT